MPRQLKPRQIEAFRAAVSKGSSTAAAESLFISQPAVSRLLSDLEESVGFALFERQGRGLIPTPDGKRFYQAVEQVYLGLETLQEVAQSIKAGELGKLRIGALPVYGEGLLAECSGLFIAANPNVTIELNSADRNDLIAGLQANRYDMAISTLPVDNKEFESVLLGQGEAVCILPPDHPFTEEKGIHLNALGKHKFIGLNGNNPFRQVIQQVVSQSGGAINEVAAARTQKAVALMVGAGAGISIIDSDVCQYLPSGLIVQRSLDPRIHWDYGVLYPSRNPPSLTGLKFIEHLQNFIQSSAGKA